MRITAAGVAAGCTVFAAVTAGAIAAITIVSSAFAVVTASATRTGCACGFVHRRHMQVPVFVRYQLDFPAANLIQDFFGHSFKFGGYEIHIIYDLDKVLSHPEEHSFLFTVWAEAKAS